MSDSVGLFPPVTLQTTPCFSTTAFLLQYSFFPPTAPAALTWTSAKANWHYFHFQLSLFVLLSMRLIIITVTMDFHAWASFHQTFFFSPCPIILSLCLHVSSIRPGYHFVPVCPTLCSDSSHQEFPHFIPLLLRLFSYNISVYVLVRVATAVSHHANEQKQCARSDWCYNKQQIH